MSFCTSLQFLKCRGGVLQDKKESFRYYVSESYFCLFLLGTASVFLGLLTLPSFVLGPVPPHSSYRQNLYALSHAIAILPPWSELTDQKWAQIEPIIVSHLHKHNGMVQGWKFHLAFSV